MSGKPRESKFICKTQLSVQNYAIGIFLNFSPRNITGKSYLRKLLRNKNTNIRIKVCGSDFPNVT